MKATGILTMIKNRMSREKLYTQPDYWDAKAVELEGTAVSLWPNNNLNELYEKEHFAFYESCVGNIENLAVMDLGCGVGNVTRYFAKRNANVSGLDFSEKAIEIARKKSVMYPNINYVVKSIFDFYEPEKYDLIHIRTCLTVACKNADELDKAIQNIAGSLKHNGKCLIIEPIHSNFLHRVLKMNLQEFKKILEKNGLEVKETRHLHFVPARLLLSYFNIPMFITKPIYHIGQWIMNTLGWQWGDYKAIYAIKK
ncbi:MAG: class I SAM-dependent methyltransferase [Chitinophagales bacterium]|nr:class I SAM-dependent methyltransferase [Chitinophagales bacterium]MDW8418666.1 class I SAM-dependent methyltransferase [Chitinophagales bacterium]